MRFLKTFFRFCTITILCTTFTTVAWGGAVNKKSEKQDGITCSNLSISTCNSYNGCAVYYNSGAPKCDEAICNVVDGCKDRAGCAYYSLACRVVEAGKYSHEGTNDYYDCPAGYYCPDGTGYKYSNPCPAGTYRSSTGGESASSCTTCTGSGTYCPAGSTSPQACSAGYYCPNTTTRRPCPAGTYNSKTAQSSSSACITCPDGTFSESSERTTVCPQCPAGYYCPDTTTKYNCPLNSFCPEGSTEYSACYNNTNGKFPETTGTNKTSVSDCCKTIAAGKYYRTDTETIYNCESGYYCIGATVCYGSTTSYAGRSTCPADQVNGRTVYSAGKTQETGATQNTDCYVHCDRKEITGGYYDETNIYYSITQQARPPLPALYGYKACPYDDVLSFPTCYTGYSPNTEILKKCDANIYKISYNLNSGTSGGKQPATATYDSEFEVSNPTRSGYTFTGWKITGMNSGVTHTYGNSTTTGTTISSTLETKFKNLHSEQDATVTFAAQWQIITYTITYELNSGTNNSSNPSSYNVETATITLANPTRTGYTFGGWYTTSNFSGSAVTQIAKGSTGNKTFYAKWTANTYTVAYNANGGSGTMNDQSRTYNDGKKLTANTFTREGYTFAGWNTKSDGTGTSYANQATGNLTSTNGATVTLHAQWDMCQDNYYCSGDKETECPELFIYIKIDNDNIPATTINDCYLDPDLTLKDNFNLTEGIGLSTLNPQGAKIFYKGN